jgi:hypothetical protein
MAIDGRQKLGYFIPYQLSKRSNKDQVIAQEKH